MHTKLVCHIEGSSIFGADTRKELQGGRLTIGRGSECDWVLNDPDRALSKQHCVIAASEDGYVLTDTSTNGVYVNGARQPLGRGQSTPLSDGHLLALGPYRIRLDIETTAPVLESALPPSITQVPEAWIDSVPQAGFGAGRAPVRAAWDGPPDPQALGATGLATAVGAEAFSSFAQQSEGGSPLSTVIRMPVVKTVLPLDWDASPDMGADAVNPLGPLLAASPKAAIAAVPTRAETSLTAAFMEGAGLPPGSLDGADMPAMFHEFGRMLRCSVLGLRDLLASRKVAKAELRVPATTVKASGNNALKLSPDAERALLAIAGQPLPGFLPGAEAIWEGLRDVKAHELALIATVSLLLNEISSQLDPAAIKAKLGGGWDLLSASKRARYWDEYETAFAALAGGTAGDRDTEAGTLMARFAAAYAAQVGEAVEASSPPVAPGSAPGSAP